MARSSIPSLVADIGGTNARFARLTADGAPTDFASLSCADYPDLKSAVDAYLDGAAPQDRPRRMVIAVASPVTGDRIEMTNRKWEFSVAALEAGLGLESLRVINDFTAVALSLRHLGADDVRQVGGGAGVPDAPIAVLGPGTGLGVSGLVPTGAGRWTPLSTEGGHVTLASTDARQHAVIGEMARRFDHVSVERAVSGQGLVNLHAALSALEGHEAEQLAPSEITARARDGDDPICAEALAMFCAMLGTAAGDLALTLGARGGVYIAGGIVPALGENFAETVFRDRFESKGRFRGYMRAIPTFVITHPTPALLGLAGLLNDPT